MLEAELTAFLAVAQRDSTHDVDAALFAQLDRPSAYRVQIGVLAALHQTAGLLKTGIHSDGVGVVAPIYAAGVGQAPGFRLPAANVIGLEVEVGVVLAKALAGTIDETRARAAIDHYFVGVEICGSRYRDRKLAGPNGGLADNMSSLGYAIGPTRRRRDQIDGLTVRVHFAGTELHSAPAKHGFGTVLASLIAYANNQHPSYPLAAGTIVTTGSMCGLVPTSGPGHVVASLGDETVEFDIV
jgi:2-keto-4-pentenoate hydratase